MRALFPVALALVFTAPALGCDQDYAASNADRESFMGDAHAAPPPTVASASAPATPPPPVPAPPPPPTPAPSASAAPPAAASAAPPAH